MLSDLSLKIAVLVVLGLPRTASRRLPCDTGDAVKRLLSLELYFSVEQTKHLLLSISIFYAV